MASTTGYKKQLYSLKVGIYAPIGQCHLPRIAILIRAGGDSISPDYLDGDIVLIDYALQPRDGDIVAALIDGFESTLKIYSRKGDEITLTPIETKRHFPRMFHASRNAIQGVLVEIVRRVPKRRR